MATSHTGSGAPWPAALTKGLPSLAAEARKFDLEALENSVASSRAQAIPTSKAAMAMEGMDVDGAAPAAAEAKVSSTRTHTHTHTRARA